MELRHLSDTDMKVVIDLYTQNKKDFKEHITLEEFCEQFLHRCDDCGTILYDYEHCENCETVEKDYDLEYFDRNKEHFIYNID